MLVYIEIIKDDKEFHEHCEYAYVNEYNDDKYDYEEDFDTKLNDYEINYEVEVDEYSVS